MNHVNDPYQFTSDDPVPCALFLSSTLPSSLPPFQVIQGGAAHQDGRLHVGVRILQINSASMHGKTYDEAMHVLQGVLDRMNLLVCFGYDPKAIPTEEEGELEASDEEESPSSSR